MMGDPGPNPGKCDHVERRVMALEDRVTSLTQIMIDLVKTTHEQLAAMMNLLNSHIDLPHKYHQEEKDGQRSTNTTTGTAGS